MNAKVFFIMNVIGAGVAFLLFLLTWDTIQLLCFASFVLLSFFFKKMS